MIEPGPYQLIKAVDCTVEDFMFFGFSETEAEFEYAAWNKKDFRPGCCQMVREDGTIVHDH